MDSTRTIMLTGAIGAGLALLLALPSVLPPAIADEEPARTLLSTPNEIWPPAFDPGKLMKWDYYVQPGVSIEPIRESTVRKIAYGRTTLIRVMETASGVYSTDGMANPHIGYPGIVKVAQRQSNLGVWYWDDGHWVATAPQSASSFVSLTPLDATKLVASDDDNCVTLGNAVYC
ncbi:MAG: hypothetical protein JWQ89_1111 [Devosia sp.]|uniref:hypothetical protein n=1 Tax=Devosia sp. TaxID=1871048 RepID=UPI00262906A7|nr:hypothetical protein [Devosia sp.]MDB5539384.1 hypothetical protein [Devosia sp.]